MKKFMGCLILAAIATSVFAQGGTCSPYSQYGLGEFSTAGGGFNRGVNGLGIGVHRGHQINPLNPASYASVDSLTMLFDMGVSGQITNYNENGTKTNSKSAYFEYVMGAFRAWKNVGVSFGLIPMTNVGYKYANSAYLPDVETTMISAYAGEGGLHQLYVGVGAKPVKQLSVGFNFAYLWGGYDRGAVTTSTSYINSLAKTYHADVSNYTLDFGIQFDQPIGKEDMLTVGLTYGLGHKLNADAECLIISSNASISKADTTKAVIENALELPHTFGAGVSYSHGTQWMVGADVQLQKWNKIKYPDYTNGQYILKDGLLDNSYRLTLGGEYCPQWNSRNFFHRVRYRLGVGYTTPYYKINGQDGPRQISATVGFGIPILNTWNNRSVLNISAQWVNNSASGLLKENTFRINLGLTFNEKWFAKWRVE
jgi:hypothetical protein